MALILYPNLTSRSPMDLNCAPLLSYLFLYSYEADFIRASQEKTKKLPRYVNFTFRYTGDVHSLHNATRGKIISFCSAYGTRHVTLDTNLDHE
jgi:hypothetical protein